MREDLKLSGSQYSWLSSIFYFGFLAWAFPTNFLMQRFPLGKYLGFKYTLPLAITSHTLIHLIAS